jgi:hypothetical protein
LTDLHRIGADRLRDVLELSRAKIDRDEVKSPLDLPIGLFGEADRAGLGDALEQSGDIDAVPIRSPSLSSTTSPK